MSPKHNTVAFPPAHPNRVKGHFLPYKTTPLLHLTSTIQALIPPTTPFLRTHYFKDNSNSSNNPLLRNPLLQGQWNLIIFALVCSSPYWFSSLSCCFLTWWLWRALGHFMRKAPVLNHLKAWCFEHTLVRIMEEQAIDLFMDLSSSHSSTIFKATYSSCCLVDNTCWIINVWFFFFSPIFFKEDGMLCLYRHLRVQEILGTAWVLVLYSVVVASSVVEDL